MFMEPFQLACSRMGCCHSVVLPGLLRVDVFRLHPERLQVPAADRRAHLQQQLLPAPEDECPARA